MVGISLAVFLTFQYMDLLASLMEPYMPSQKPYLPFLSATVIFIGTLAIVNLITYISNKVLKAAQLSTVNRVAGMTFGMLKVCLVISATLLIMAGFEFPPKETRDQSVTYPYLLTVAPAVYNVIAVAYPGAESFAETIEKSIEEYKSKIQLPNLEPSSTGK